MSEKQTNSISDLVFNRTQTSASVEYRLYKEDTKINGEPNLKGEYYTYSGACFSQLRFQEKDNNRINYKPVTVRQISKETSIQWIDLCVEEGLLPDYVDGETVVSKGIVLDLKQPRSLVYSQLCLVRYIAEETDLIKAVLFLVKQKVNIFAALILAGKTTCNNSNHNFIPGTGCYSYPKISGIKIPLNSVIGLRRFWKNPAEYDKGQLYFMAFEIISSACPTVGFDLSLNWSDYKNPYIIKAIKSKKEDTINRAIKKYQEQKEKKNEKSIIGK